VPALAGLALGMAGCGGGPPGPAPTAPMDGAIARVGSALLPQSLVVDVAAATGATPRSALDDLVADALAAEAAKARGLDRVPDVSWRVTSALARTVPARIADEAGRAGPPTADELQTLTVVHAVVMRSPRLREEDALAIARVIRKAVMGARSADEFQARANAVAHPHAQVIAQPIGPFGADGKDPGGGSLDPGFVAASFALRTPLETSPVVESPFGWHVIQLVERKASNGPPPDPDFERAVLRLRGRMALDALLRTRREGERVEVSGGADALLDQLSIAP
jgi:hypothetical protein